MAYKDVSPLMYEVALLMPDVLLTRTYSIVGGDLATPIREFQDASGVAWLEAIFVSGQNQTLERQPKWAFQNLILQEVL